MLELILILSGFIYSAFFSKYWLIASVVGIALYFIKEFFKK